MVHTLGHRSEPWSCLLGELAPRLTEFTVDATRNSRLRFLRLLRFELGLCRRPLFEHLLNGLRYHLRVFVAIVAQRILSNPPPNERLGLGVV